MFAIVLGVITKTTISDYDTIIAVTISGLLSLGIAYYFHKRNTPAQRTWNEKRRETIEDMLDLFEQLSREVRIGSKKFDENMEKSGYSKQAAQSFMTQNTNAINKIENLRILIHQYTERNYNYITNKESRKFKMHADTFKQYLQLKFLRPSNYLDDVKYLENPRTITKDLSEIFAESNETNKEFLKRGVFTFDKSDLNPRWVNMHKY